MMKNYFLIALLCMGVFACKKETKTTPEIITKTKTDYLTKSPWVLTGERLSTDNGAYADTYGNYAACQKDNQLAFASNGTYTNTEGATKCSASNPQTIQQGVWVFTSSETILSTTPTGGTKIDLSILQLDDTTLKMVYSYSSGGHTYKSEGTYTHP